MFFLAKEYILTTINELNNYPIPEGLKKKYQHDVWSLFFIPEWYNESKDEFFFGYSFNEHTRVMSALTKVYLDPYVTVPHSTPITLFNMIYNHHVRMLNLSKTRGYVYDILVFIENKNPTLF